MTRVKRIWLNREGASGLVIMIVDGRGHYCVQKLTALDTMELVRKLLREVLPLWEAVKDGVYKEERKALVEEIIAYAEKLRDKLAKW